MPRRKAGRGQPRVPPPYAEFAKCQPELVAAYRLHWLRLAAFTRTSPYDWDDRAVSRFSHPEHPFKILYLADEKETARCLALFSRPDERTMESLVLMRAESSRRSIISDPDTLRLLVQHDIDMR